MWFVFIPHGHLFLVVVLQQVSNAWLGGDPRLCVAGTFDECLLKQHAVTDEKTYV